MTTFNCFVAIFLMALSACSDSGQPKSAKKSETIRAVDTTWVVWNYPRMQQDTYEADENKNFNSMYTGTFIDPHTVLDCNLYAAPDSASEVKQKIAAMTPVTVRLIGTVQLETQLTEEQRKEQEEFESRYSDSTNGEKPDYWRLPHYGPARAQNWTKVETADGTVGYVASMAIARFVFHSADKKFMYMVSSKPGKDGEEFLVEKYDAKSYKRLSRVSSEQLNESALHAEEIRNLPYQGLRFLIRLTSSADFCGGGQSVKFIGDNGNELVEFPGSYIFYSDGSDFSSTASYLATIGPNAKLRLIANANVDGKTPAEHFKPQQLAGPKIPLNQLLVTERTEGFYVTDANDEIIPGKNGDATVEQMTTTTTWYRWNGKGFKQVKQAISKKIH